MLNIFTDLAEQKKKKIAIKRASNCTDLETKGKIKKDLPNYSNFYLISTKRYNPYKNRASRVATHTNYNNSSYRKSPFTKEKI